MKRLSYNRIIIALCLIAAIAYNSWPLGYLLDSSTAHLALASDLEKIGHPFYWIFILGDVLSGLSAIGISLLIWFKVWPQFKSRIWATTCIGLVIFGLFTALSAIIPSECALNPAFRCVYTTHNIGLDALTSSLAALGLLISLLSVSRLHLRIRWRSLLLPLTQTVMIAWATSGILFSALAVSGGNDHLIQQLLITFSGLGLIVIGLNVAAVLVEPGKDVITLEPEV